MNRNPLCIYHGNCADGFGAAWVVRRANQAERENGECGEQVEFHAGVYQTPPPEDIVDRHIIMVDFSYKRNVLLEMAAKASSILILDHHKTAQADLVDLPKNVETVFDMDRSGARLAWDYFFPLSPVPELILHIEDRDLWRFYKEPWKTLRPYTRQIQANIFSHPYDFELWDGLMAMPKEVLRDFARQGEAIERKHFKDIHELLAVVQHERTIGGYRVPVANLPYIHSSDAGHTMAKGKPFAACYWDVPDGRVFSLRSEEDGIDVSEIAKQYGGGGHKHAAGFKVPNNHVLAQREEAQGEKGGPELSTNLQQSASRS